MTWKKSERESKHYPVGAANSDDERCLEILVVTEIYNNFYIDVRFKNVK